MTAMAGDQGPREELYYEDARKSAYVGRTLPRGRKLRGMFCVTSHHATRKPSSNVPDAELAQPQLFPTKHCQSATIS